MCKYIPNNELWKVPAVKLNRNSFQRELIFNWIFKSSNITTKQS